MSADGSITLQWADGEYRFRLAIGQWRELQEVVNRWRSPIGLPSIGPNSLARALITGDAWPGDVHEVVRLGLIGGGMKPFDALTLVKRYVDDRPLLESSLTAHAILMAGIVGVPDDPVGKPETETATTEATPTETAASSSPSSTVSALH